MRLKTIDPIMLPDHIYLTKDDVCYYFGEYTSGVGYAHSDFNRLILNLKKSPAKQNTPEWGYKLGAIETIAEWLYQLIQPHIELVKATTFVPMPPSKTKSHPDYDDRISSVLHKTQQKLENSLEIRELVETIKDREQLHNLNTARLTPHELSHYFKINESLMSPTPSKILLVDDIITSGTHFRVIKDKLLSLNPRLEIKGLFFGRRIFPL